MNNLVNNFKKTNDDIFLKFGVKNKYFISVLDDYNWEIINDNDIYLIKYYKDDFEQTNFIIQKNDVPLVYVEDGYTMIIAIDCVKVAFVFKNDLKR